MRRVIVTGGSGFIGTLISTELAAEGVDVHVWTRGQTDAGGLDNNDNIHLRVVDIYDLNAVSSALRDTPSAEMIHLGWGGLPNYMSTHHMDHELIHQIRFVRCVIKAGIKSLTQTGTCFEYGAQNGELHENMTCKPTSPYGYAKLALLRYVEFLSQTQAFRYKWLRLFYMYGPGQGPKSLYSQLSAAQSRGDTTFDMSSGHQIRDFSPISDIVARIIALHDPAVVSGVYNVCSGKPVSVRQLVEQWCTEMDYDVVINLGRYSIPSYEPLAFWGSAARMHAALEMNKNA